MEPLNATALYTADKCEVWCGTQNGEAAFAATLEASGLPADKCDVHKQMLGGGFGRRGQTDYVRQAVAIAKQMPGTPIKLLWSREEDMQHGAYHPITQCKIDRRLRCRQQSDRVADADVRTVDPVQPASRRRWSTARIPATFAGLNATGEAAIGYSVPNLLIDHSMRNPHVPPGFWRGVNVNHNAIYLECFMDELAHSVGPGSARVPAQADGQASEDTLPCSMRWPKKSAGTSRRRKASSAASRSTWAMAAMSPARRKSRSPTATRSRCIASSPPPIRAMPSIRRRSSGRSPARSSMACRACSMADAPSRTAASNRSNFDTYNSMRIAEMPKVESIVMPSGGFWGGVGEPTICVAATCGAQCLFRGDRKTHPLGAAAGSEHHLRLTL